MEYRREQGEGPVEGTKPTVVRLDHPSGSQVYVVGGLTFSPQSQVDAVETIGLVKPVTVVLDTDEGTYHKVDGLGRGWEGSQQAPSSYPGLLRVYLSGQLPSMVTGVVLRSAFALLGSDPSAEVRAVRRAAQEVGAQVQPAGRSPALYRARLAAHALQIQNQELRRGQADMARMRRLMDDRPGAAGGLDADRDVGRPPDFMHREISSKPERPAEDSGLGRTPFEVQAKIEEMMAQAGCQQPNEVLLAAKRLLKEGLAEGGPISGEDVMRVRGCGLTVLERLRRDAASGDAHGLSSLLSEVESGAGQLPRPRWFTESFKALNQETATIMARRLWEAGQSSGGQPVVGLVSASTLPDIRKLWPAAGSPAIQARAEEYLQDPGMQAPGAGVVGFAVPALSLAMIGIMAYRRPRVAAYVFGGLAAISAPSILLQLVAMNRFASFTDRLERVARDLDAGGPGGDSFSFGEWQ
uniref:Uncharacterized protein n=1 Tax=Auxenochlorella protothecoides TaxID=3075 RepID=A0A1D1ZPV5_AUXPR